MQLEFHFLLKPNTLNNLVQLQKQIRQTQEAQAQIYIHLLLETNLQPNFSTHNGRNVTYLCAPISHFHPIPRFLMLNCVNFRFLANIYYVLISCESLLAYFCTMRKKIVL